MHKGTKPLLALFGASAITLSCTACLGPSSLSYTPMSASAPTKSQNAIPADQSLIRTTSYDRRTSAPVTTVPTVAQQSARASYSQASLSRPLGQVNGIDLTVAQFADSVAQSPRVDLTYRGKVSQPQNLNAGYTFLADSEKTGFGLDLAVRPHVTINDEGAVRSTRAGAEVRVGQNLDLRGQNANNSNWYLFAGADGEAVVWDVQRTGLNDLTNGQVTLQDKVTVGDVQAGIAFESPAGQMSISYIERDYEYRNGAISRSGTEEFAAVTLTWRH